VTKMDNRRLFLDAHKNAFFVKDVAGLGDCAILALLANPAFKVPVSNVQDLRHAVVSFARDDACRDECAKVYALMSDKNAPSFDLYLEKVEAPRFWVGTIFFIWASMLYGIDIVSHSFNAAGDPTAMSTASFLKCHLKDSDLASTFGDGAAVNLFFHQYGRMSSCIQSRYNHFACLISVGSSHPAIIDSLNHQVKVGKCLGGRDDKNVMEQTIDLALLDSPSSSSGKNDGESGGLSSCDRHIKIEQDTKETQKKKDLTLDSHKDSSTTDHESGRGNDEKEQDNGISRAPLLPWWMMAKKVNNIDCVSVPKLKKKKKDLNKIERHQLNQAVTMYFVRQMTEDNTGQMNECAEMLNNKLKQADQSRAQGLHIARKLNIAFDIDVDVEFDQGLSHKRVDTFDDEDTTLNAADISKFQVAAVRRITNSYDKRSWLQRSVAVFIFLHDKLGAQNWEDTCALTRVNVNTLKTWLTQPRYVVCWIKIVEQMVAKDAIAALPTAVQEKFADYVDPGSKVCVSNFKMKSNRHVERNKGTQLTLLFSGGNDSTSKKVALARRNKDVTFVSQKTERLRGGGRPIKYRDLTLFILSTVTKAWETGMPITKAQLFFKFLSHVNNSGNQDAISMFVTGKINTMQKFVSRTLTQNRWSARKTTISQSVPTNWRVKAEANAFKIRNAFKDAKVDVVINADETFVRFHSLSNKLIAPTGTKRIGTAAQVDNEKCGATVMVACEYRTSMVLPPMIIFTGVYGATLMQKWSKYENCKVVFNESHWMTSNTAILYICYLIKLFPGKMIGLIWDKHTSHVSDEVRAFIEKTNADPNIPGTHIVMETVDEGLTPIIQVPDVALNKDIKAGISEKYYQYRLECDIKIGVKITVPREKFVEFVEKTFAAINRKNEKNPMIADAFRYCGLNPWSNDSSIDAFKCHLDALESNDILHALITNQSALNL